MTTRTKQPLACECGHSGSLCCSETDQPYGGLWESYKLEGFKGDSPIITSSNDMPNDMLAALKPVCPECGKSGAVRFQ